jgi:predicted NBD/HSP70 family sugar kinase
VCFEIGMKTIGAVDIGGTKIAVGAVREDGRIVKQCACPTEPEKGFQQAMKRVAEMLRDLSGSGATLLELALGARARSTRSPG